MLVTLNEILALAAEKNCAVGAFNTPNLECITAVLNAAEALNVPVIISHADSMSLWRLWRSSAL